jgi:hypothetical protein
MGIAWASVTILETIFTGKKSKIWCIGDKIFIANARLELEELEGFNVPIFFKYYFPILEDILPAEYFNHFCMFSYSLNVLLQEKVSIENIKKCEALFKKFVKDTEKIYGVQQVGINIHFLTHLFQCVLDWECLWSYSTFIPEWLNGELLTLKHGSQAVAAQMANNYLLKMEVREKVVSLENNGQVFPPDVKKFLHESLHLPESFHDETSFTIGEGKIILLGSSQTRVLNLDEEIAFMNFLKIGAEEIDRPTVQAFPRLEKQSTKSIFTTSKYTLSPKR